VDRRLRWNPSQSGFEWMSVSSDRIWKPDLRLLNASVSLVFIFHDAAVTY